MNAQNVDEILTVLAAKFGTTVAHLWDVLVRQAYVEGALAAFWVVVSAAVLWNAALRLPRHISAAQKASYSDDAPHIIRAVLWAALLVVFVVVGGVNLDVAVKSLANPEFSALKFILEAR